MDLHVQKINRSLIIGWMVIVGVLITGYGIEILKGEMTVPYFTVFGLVTVLPALFCLYLYRRKPDMANLRYFIVTGYFCMYLFCMITGGTDMIFSYILPLLSLLILYHQPRLILYTGVVSIAVNIISIGLRATKGEICLANSKESEIQIILLIMCFGGGYLATKLYDESTKQNKEYLDILNDKAREMREVTMQVIMTIASTVDAKDEYTRGHSKRVSQYAAAIASELKMSEEDVQNIRFAALLHDIGKIGVPDAILNKAGELTEEEYDSIKQHSMIGSEILKDITMFPEADIAAKYHHERYDGAGYPYGLAGEEIPFTARVVAVADAYEAITNDRIYRKQMDKEAGLQEIRERIGTQFDPVVAKALICLVEEGRLSENTGAKEEEGEPDDVAVLLKRFAEKREERVKGSLRYDSMTNVYNRSYGERMIRSALKQRRGSLLLIELDFFKAEGNIGGFMQMDLWIRTIALCIRHIEADKIVSRFGESRFAVYLKEAESEKDVLGWLESFQEEVDGCREKQERLKGLSVSIGITLEKGRDSYSAMIRRADKALYMAKKQGGDCHYFYDDTYRAPDNENMTQKDMESFLEIMKNENGREEKLRNLSPGLEEIDSFIKRREAANGSRRMQILLITVAFKKRAESVIEEKEWIMELLEKAILTAIHVDDMTVCGSSSQRIVILTDTMPEQVSDIWKSITDEFFRLYHRKDVVVSYKTADFN